MSKPELLNDYNSLFPDVANKIVPKYDLLANIKFNKLVEFIIKEVQNIPDHQNLKNNFELVKLICNIIENKVVKKDNIDKKAVVIEGLKRVFNLVEHEIKNIETFIEFLHKNKKIKKLSYLKKYIVPAGKFFLKLAI
jgi:hypothetical protein